MDNRAQQASTRVGGKLLGPIVRRRAATPAARGCPRSRHSASPCARRRFWRRAAALGSTGKGPTYPARVGPRHPEHGRRWIHDARAQLEHLGLRAPPGARATARRRRSRRATDRPFIATSAPVGATSGIDQPSSRSSGATARDVTTSNVRRSVQLLGATAHDLDVVEPELADHLVEERRAPQQRLDQRHRDVGARDRHHHAREGRRPCRCRTRSTPSGIASPSTAELSTCRSHSRSASRGPIRPRTTPSVARSSV